MKRNSRNSRKKPKRRKSKKLSMSKSITNMAIGLGGLGLGATLQSLSKKVLPKQGFVFTPAFEETGDNCLLIIDPQNDFIDGSLAVGGANADMEKLCEFIQKNIEKINSVCVTLDTHSLFHIGNSYAYKGKEEKDMGAYSEEYIPKQAERVPDLKQHINSYAKKLEKQGKSHWLWPLHCQLGTKGHAICENLNEKLKKWSDKSLTEVRYIIKGCDTRYENFSVFRSAGVDKHNYSNPNKEAYKFNLDLAKHLYQFKNLYIAGEARTHCVLDSTSDYVDWVKSKGNPKKQQIYILWNCMSDVQVPSVEDFFKGNREAFEKLIIDNSSFMHKVEKAETELIK